ncbi:hypothetical protein Mapa_015940 [Marchantia paleacea]|nr:hypothetical protein Mapa_015940 [Marchantia paleacea]
MTELSSFPSHRLCHPWPLVTLACVMAGEQIHDLAIKIETGGRVYVPASLEAVVLQSSGGSPKLYRDCVVAENSSRTIWLSRTVSVSSCPRNRNPDIRREARRSGGHTYDEHLSIQYILKASLVQVRSLKGFVCIVQ